MDIVKATKEYEKWMRACGPVINAELRDKHMQMKKDPLLFFRGTYYRWAQLWPEICSKVTGTPTVLSVGDLHVDSFGTWRDVEGRMCWGVDDFDEAWPLPYTNDLIRLATSVKIARKNGLLSLKNKEACDIILAAYERTLRESGCPIVLAEEERHLEKLGIEALKPAKSFWQKLNDRPAIHGKLPREAKKALEKSLPEQNLEYKVVRREAGLGSLGQLRFVAIAECHGGCVAREAKNVVPSASLWLNGRKGRQQPYYGQAISSAVRSRDPYQVVHGSWLIRRLSPDSNPIEIEDLPKKRDEGILLQAMGTEAANVHLGDRKHVRAILSDLKRRKPNWLRVNVQKMAKKCLQDWKDYRNQ